MDFIATLCAVGTMAAAMAFSLWMIKELFISR
jgi:hypothetical protein